MRLPTAPTIQVVEHLNTTYFNQVWNSPADHGRANFILNKANARLQTGAVPVGLSVVGLPTTDAVYAVYQAGYGNFGRFIKLPEDQWVRDNDVLANAALTITVYDANGRVLPAGQLWLRWMPMNNQVLVAIDKVYTAACVGQSFPELFATVYIDTSRNTPIVTSTFTVNSNPSLGVPVQTVTNAILQAKTAYPAGTTVMVNGWVYDPTTVPSLANGDIVVIVSDPDIVGYCNIPVDDNVTGYYSDLFGEYRELLHIPKILNPQNIILTHDTLTVVVFNSANNQGVLGHRVDQNAVESVTHNDFSMGRSVIQSFSQSLGAQNVTVRVYVRYPTHSNLLHDDVNHLSDLYSLPEIEIMKQLIGTSEHQIAEWQAANLEQSGFLNLLYEFSGFKADDAIVKYTNAMGYYDVASVLGQQMRFYTYKGAQVEIIKPTRLFGYDCQVIVYANGRKVPEDKLAISNYSSKGFLLGFKLESGVAVGDRIAVYIVEAGPRVAVPYNPTSDNPSITLDNEDYVFFEKFNYDEPQSVWKNTVTVGYRAMVPSPADYTVTQNTDGSFKYQVKEPNFGKHYYLVPPYGLNTAVYNLRAPVVGKDAIVIDLTTLDINADTMPILGFNTLEVYLNGYRLIPNLDYEYKFTLGPNGDILQNLMTVSNCDYLDVETFNNTLEVVVHGDTAISEDSGYAINNHLYRTNFPMIWTRSSSRVFVHGILQETVSESGNVITTGSDVEQGAPFLVQYMLAFGAKKLLGDISPNQDNNLRARINHVLGIIPPVYPDTVLIEHLYALYSPFLAEITTDVGYGRLFIVDEANNDKFLAQFKPYSPLFERDPTIGPNNSLIDRRFVTLAAHYANFAVEDPEQMIRLQRLITLTLTPSDLSLKEVLL